MCRSLPPRIRLIGNALIDLVMRLPRWPDQDEELRASGFQRRCGGNGANTALALAGQGCAVQLIAALADDRDGQWLREHLCAAGIDLNACEIHERGHTPVSSVWLVESVASRAIAHFRNLNELSPAYLADLEHHGWDWLHLEGRNVPGLRCLLPARGIDRMRCSLELEKPREGLESMLADTGWAIVSAAYARSLGETPVQLLERLRAAHPHLRVVLTQGVDGVWLAGPAESPRLLPPPRRLETGDSLGAGDRFIAGLIAALVEGCGTIEAVDRGQAGAIAGMTGA